MSEQYNDHLRQNSQELGTTALVASMDAEQQRAQKGSLAWKAAENVSGIRTEGVHLGAIKGADGWNAGYKDYSETPVEQAGLSFGVKQASYGYTGIFAKPLDGFKLEALSVDNSNNAQWIAGAPESGEVTVTADWGKLSETSWDDISAGANLGIEGGRAGIVRVTEEATGASKYYALGADFRGEPDNWDVTGAMVEIVPGDMQQEAIGQNNRLLES